jgi:Selenocysteine synthase N terminal
VTVDGRAHDCNDMTATTGNLNVRLRELPSVDDILKADAAALAIARFGRPAAVTAVRQALQFRRRTILTGVPASLKMIYS